ncbi:MAG: MopE-related protein [Deltaproteobacteria bacterium]|jgi:hypothetical protein
MSRQALLGSALWVCGILFAAACNPAVDDDDSTFIPPPPPPGCQTNEATMGLELCNNIDDDCDGDVDEGDDGGILRQACDLGCGGGLQTCENGAWGECVAAAPKEEVCNGIDDNCNDEIDEGCECIHGMTQPCGTDVGACRAGIQQCVDGVLNQECFGEIGPEPMEICTNGVDDNCDGNIDEGCQCTPNDTQTCGIDEGACRSGTLTCDGQGQWSLVCDGAIDPVAETCNGIDDDCDGRADWNIATGVGWDDDPFEGSNTCGGATSLPNAVDGGGWISLNVSDPANLQTYPTIYPIGDEDWYRFRAEETSHGACFPGSSQCAFVLVVQLELSGAANEEDYEVCVAVTDNCTAVGPDNLICSTASRWVPSANSYVMGVKWGGTCGGDDSRQVKVRVRNKAGAQSCSYYQIHAHFEYDPEEPCP